MPELLLEILSKEIPARMQARAASELKRLVTAGLKDAGLEFTAADAYVTPRRLVLVVEGVPEKQPDVSEEKRGPNVNAPEQAVNGFKGSLPDDAVIEERETPKGTFFFATIDKKGAAASDVLAGIAEKAMGDLPWSKSMRWGNRPERWVRPMHSIICLFDGAEVSISVGDVMSGATTVGHRFLASEPFMVKDFADYKKQLMDAKVMLDPADRSTKIETDAKALAEKAGVVLKDDPGLLAEVTGLVEWPIVLMGTIEDQFMELPDEVLITSMRSHQKYFACLNADGTLANKFIVVANTETADGGAQIVAGNERVLRARLSDAKFFWDQDRAKTLESRVDALADRVFHAKLGNLLEKVDRVEKLAVEIAKHVDGADDIQVARAARLAKADLSTGMVAEFPDLQGLMGQYYAVNDGEDVAVANAIAEHYSPVGPNDACPTAPVSVCVALADKIDSLVGFFAIDEKPTGSKDPFALRRSALGIIRLILENECRINLTMILRYSVEQYRSTCTPEIESNVVIGSLLNFFADRLTHQLRDQGVKHDYLKAVFSQKQSNSDIHGDVDLVRVVKRVRALTVFLTSDDGANLLVAHRRAANIVEKESMKYEGLPEIESLVEGEEIELNRLLSPMRQQVDLLIRDEAFVDVMSLLAELRGPIDAFFENVKVISDDEKLRTNRLRLLTLVKFTMDEVADFSEIEDG